MKKIIFFLVFTLLLTSCFAGQRKIEGLTDGIYSICSGIWTSEPIENRRITGWKTSWGRAYGNTYSLLIDLRSSEDIDIWPDMGAIVVRKVEKIDKNTIKFTVDPIGISYQTDDGKFKPIIGQMIIMHLLPNNCMWIDSRDDRFGAGTLFYLEGPDHIYKKVSGPDVEPLFTEKSDEKEFMSPP
ncbi:MAG: membrane lipoprotein lipid attachment site-containing protein [Spirochaetia bacterium]|jgi:hypothetical protein|nr:membrane lipoprotein lipid attachment site-containing protein [Spirochaetia bacterium]